MLGRKHKNKSKFRKNTYGNVDYDNFIIEYSPAKNKRIKYKTKCNGCNADRGYQRNVDAKRLCRKCRDNSIRMYTTEHRRIRSAMKANLSARLRNRLINKNRKSTFDILDYTVDELKKHLESKFQSGMSWDNYGKWEIDHVTPDSWFKYNSFNDDDFKKSWALNNLQPLWAADNRAKSNKRSG